MKYRVIWEKQAEDDLAELWMSADDRDAVAQLAREIDEILKRDGLMAGESRDKTVRILFNLPLACYFQYRESDHAIFVVQLWRC